MSLQPGARLSNYEVLSELGSGGMGEVYKARDLKLGREVAIKVLPQEMASDSQSLRRFEQEARAASALNHPNIITIYEIGEHEGTPYIAMEYVEGRTLREMLAGGPLPNEKLLRYATQMAEGLAKAHQAGIVHRDLKPENIVVSEDGYVKILDFGLAKLMPLPDEGGSEAATLAQGSTTPGTILGTVGYMSPEQAKGAPADFRSDQFSFGAIVYEMATGKRAFERESATQTLTAIIENEPEPITVANPRVAATTGRVIDRCLSKDPKDRYDSTWDIAKDIHWEEQAKHEKPSRRLLSSAIGTVGALALILVIIFGLFATDIRDWVGGEADTRKIESLAVLPLENLSGDPEQEYFSDGMTEALIADLAKISAIRVISRQSVMRFKGADTPLPQIARTLQVDAVIEGSVVRSGNRVRITTQLIRAEPEEHLWAESYERELQDILALQSDVAREIAKEIRVTVTPQEQARLESTRDVNPEAHEAYLKGRFYAREARGESRAVAEFNRAIEIDSSYAPAYSALAAAEVFSLPSNEHMPKAREAALKALELEETLAEAHSALALVKFYYDWDWSGAESGFRRATDLDPGSAEAHHRYGTFLWALGRFDDAIAEIRRAQTLDPLAMFIHTDLARSYYFARRYDQAVVQYQRTLELDPEFYWARFFLGITFEQMGREAEAVAQVVEARKSIGDADLAIALSEGFDRDGITGYLRAWADFWETAGQVQPTSLAMIYARLGEQDKAFELLERAYQERTRFLVYLNVEPQFDPLRSDPRFQDLLRRMNFPE